MSYDEDEHAKEVFAAFGLTYYLSSVFEYALAHALLTQDFLTKQKEVIEHTGKEHFDRKKFAAEFDAFLASQHTKTLGNLLRRIQELIDTDDPMKALLTTAKIRRDFLAHHFFRERAEDFARRTGRDRMLTELREAQELFEAVDQRLTAFVDSILAGFGIPKEMIETRMLEYIRKVESEGEE